jgi:hypothetical protein
VYILGNTRRVRHVLEVNLRLAALREACFVLEGNEKLVVFTPVCLPACLRTLMSARLLEWGLSNDSPLVELRKSLGQVRFTS